MDRTDRRFKVVFAGLHNVQRTSRSVNTPLAHLGEPVCIGPLLEKGGARAAIDLIRKPLESIGYRFTPGALPLRIVSHTNYYPSLIQVYCKHLLEQLSDSGRTHFAAHDSPPYLIKAEHLEAAENVDLRAKIQEKFRLTLELDLRYRLIALCIAFEKEGRLGGVEPVWVRRQALYWWDAGFEDKSSEAFSAILDEMVGLGILRKNGHRYALRSPNLANLLGTRAEIEQTLLEAGTRWKQPPPYEAASFRRSPDGEPWLRSPLTALQESELLGSLGVSVLFGTPLSGLPDVERFLRLASERHGFAVIDGALDLGTFVRALRQQLDSIPEGLSLLVVPSRLPWSETWVLQAAAELARRGGRKRLARIVFVGDARQAWHWAGLDDKLKMQLSARGVSEMSLRPWNPAAVRPLMDAIGVNANTPGADEEIQQRTGNWHMLVMRFAQLARPAQHRWREQLSQVSDETMETAWLESVGILPEVAPVLSAFRVLNQPATVGQLCELEPGFPRPMVERVARWVDLVSYGSPNEGDEVQLDPFISTMLAVHV